MHMNVKLIHTDDTRQLDVQLLPISMVLLRKTTCTNNWTDIFK